MSFDSMLPFWRAGIGDLWSLSIADACMYIVGTGDAKVEILALIVEARCMDHHPMGEVRSQAQLGKGFLIFAGLDSGVCWPTTMRFNENGNATALTQLSDALEDLNIFCEVKNIATSMAIDKHDLTLYCKLELRLQAL